MEKVLKTIESNFKNLFPNSFFKVNKTALFNPDKPSYSITIALKGESFPNNIIQNDVMYHVIMLYTEQDKIQIERGTGGLALKPALNSFMAMDIVKTKLRKKTGTEQQIINHVNKWLIDLKALVVENKDNLYGNAQDYQNYIV